MRKALAGGQIVAVCVAILGAVPSAAAAPDNCDRACLTGIADA